MEKDLQIKYSKALQEVQRERNALRAENEQLKQQLAEKEKEIEDARNTHIYRFYLDKDKVQDVYMTDVMLKVFNQDKISFCVEQLEKVKKVLVEKMKLAHDKLDCAYEIDNQIKQLKEGE